jgi:hypothetical protein
MPIYVFIAFVEAPPLRLLPVTPHHFHALFSNLAELTVDAARVKERCDQHLSS